LTVGGGSLFRASLLIWPNCKVSEVTHELGQMKQRRKEQEPNEE